MIYVLTYALSDPTSEQYQDVEILGANGLGKTQKFMISREDDLPADASIKAKLLIESTKNRGILNNDQRWPIFSEKLMSVLAKFAISYNKIPVQLEGFKTKSLVDEPYTALQIPRQSNYIDKEKSIYEVSKVVPTKFNVVKKFVFNLPEDSQSLFRIKEYFALLFVTKELKLAIEEANIEGIQFIPAEEYDSTVLY